MSTIKISQLPLAAALNSNTGNTIFAGVDLQVGTTYGYSATVLANKLYANNVLNVGQAAVTLPNTIAQFSLAGESYVQTNFVNTNGGGSADHVITANNGTDSTYFLDLGLANPAYQPGSEFNNIGTAVRPLDGYLYVQGGTTSGLLGGNLVVGTTTTGTQIRFIVGGGTSSNVVANMTSTGLVMTGAAGITTSNLTATGNVITSTITTTKGTNNNLLIDPDGTGDVYFPTDTEVFVQSTNDSTGTGSGALQVSGGVTVGANLYAANIYTTGSLTATGSLKSTGLTVNTIGSTSFVVNSGITVNNNTFGPTTSAMRIDGSDGFIAQPTSQPGTMLQVIGLANTSTRVILDSYSTAGNAYSIIAGRQARGTALSPSASQSGDVLSRFSGNGYGATGYSPLGVGRMDFVAAENYTDTNKGSYIQFSVVPVGSNAFTQNVVVISATGLTTNNITANTITANAVSSTLSTVGTWTPNVQFTTQGTVTYTANTGSFVKTGRQVSAYFTLSASTSGSSGNMSIANLPFSSATTAGTVGITTIVGSVIGPSTGNMGYISGNVSSGASSTQLYVTVNTGNGSLTNEPVTGGTGTGGIGTPFTISGVISYISAS